MMPTEEKWMMKSQDKVVLLKVSPFTLNETD